MVRNTSSKVSEPNSTSLTWYCLRCQPKKERIALMHLRKEARVEAFAPRISFYKKTKTGKKRFIEALFPGYAFVCCDIKEQLRLVLSMHGITGIVRYGSFIPSLPNQLMADLMNRFNNQDAPLQVKETFEPGSEVAVVEGTFKNLNAIVECYLPAKERIQVLINFLGRELSLTLPAQTVLPVKNQNIRSSICYNS